MSQETQEWLNENTLTGFGVKPWHYVEGRSRAPFANAIPLNAISNFYPKIELERVATERDGFWIVDEDNFNVVSRDRDDKVTSHRIAGKDYVPHQYEETLIIPELGNYLATAGILSGGGVAWAQYQDPKEDAEVHGVEFATKLLATTSCNGRYSTNWKWTTTLVVCDNTLAAAQSRSKSDSYARHTKYSESKVESILEKYRVLGDVTEFSVADFQKKIETTVTDRDIENFFDELFPNSVPGVEAPTRAVNFDVKKRDETYDWLNGKFGSWKNTAFGALQSVDAQRRWDQGRNSGAENNWTKIISGELDKQHKHDEKVLQSVLSN